MQDEALPVEAMYERLDYYLQNYGSERSIMTVSELDGFVTAIGCSKDVLSPDDWFPAIWGVKEDQPNWPVKDEEDEFYGLVMLLHLEAVDGLINGNLNPLYLEHDDDKGHVTVIVEDWCAGFLRGARLTGLSRCAEREFIDEVMAGVRLFGSPRGWEKLDAMSDAERQFWRETLEPSVTRLAQYNHPEIQTNDDPSAAPVLH
ncbi:UPF0149 family protein [Marinomonas ostreistagni]|uniref:UPF0149 family protein n=1 Tax=Marinomonas ostreistagni TaxID=359209 RepID=UPI001952178B|nr:UPF0149 family protein [Marinomonas ostreistagni]MBM6551168.1 UPF0149 family protein [Marinomonas ostreistagni]